MRRKSLVVLSTLGHNETVQPQPRSLTHVLGVSFFVALAVLYVVRLPTTVQFGDTAELVMAAVGRFNAHPPGYPLWVWFQEAFISAVPVSTEYWRASFASALFSLAAYVLLWLHLKRGALAFGLVATLAFSRVVWRYSLLPDVFSLHVLFSAIVLYLYFQEGRKRWHGPALVFSFCLAFSHHLTIVFLTPVVWHVMWRDRKNAWIWIGLVAGSLVSAALYLSMQIRNPESLYSWGEITSFRAVVDHFLRKDYGTFQLVGTNEEGSLLANFAALGRTLVESLWALGLIAIAAVAGAIKSGLRRHFDRYDLFAFVSLVLYGFVFLGLSNTPLDGYRIEVIERFFIFIEVIACFWLGRFALKILADRPPMMKQVAAGLLAVAAVANFVCFEGYNDFSRNHLVDEYLRNFFAEAPTDKKTVLVTATDTRYFGARFAQTVLGVRPDVVVTSPKALIFAWAAKKFVAASGLSFDAGKVLRTQHLDITSDLILPNIDRAVFLSLYPLNEPTRYKITLLPIGRWIEKGTGSGLLETSLPHPLTKEKVAGIEAPLHRYDVHRDLTMDYLNYRLSFAKIVAEHGQVERALRSIVEFREIMPYARTLARAECDLRAMLGQPNLETCRAEQARIEKTTYHYEVER